MSIKFLIQNSNSIILKIGSVLITDRARECVKQDWLKAFAQDIKALQSQGKTITIVSSGAIALGRKALGISAKTPPSSIPLELKQAASAVGQFHLFAAYYEVFSAAGLQAAQVLLTMSETENRRMHLNARATINTLHAKNIIPIINENDTISTGEIRFGDNDCLAVRVGQMIEADAVFLLSTTDGLYTADPAKDPSARHIPLIEKISQDHIDMAGDAVPGLSTGGMKSKIEAAISATRAGISLAIANGMGVHALASIATDPSVRASVFLANDTPHGARKRWIEAHLKPKGNLYVDDGALAALRSGKSLLPIGVKKADGAFARGDIVTIKTLNGEKIGTGVCAYGIDDTLKIMNRSSKDIESILGYFGREELVHRDDLVLTT